VGIGTRIGNHGQQSWVRRRRRQDRQAAGTRRGPLAELTNNSIRHRYEMVVDDWTAYMTYAQAENTITLVHTSVPTALEGKGVGSNLVRAVLENVRTKDLKVVAECAFVAGFIKRHPEFQDLLGDPAQGGPS
jgi:predicted GNAT family acetyltransferase